MGSGPKQRGADIRVGFLSPRYIAFVLPLILLHLGLGLVFLVGFSPPLKGTDVVTDTLRVTIDTEVTGWNEIDAVGLFGVPAEP